MGLRTARQTSHRAARDSATPVQARCAGEAPGAVVAVELTAHASDGNGAGERGFSWGEPDDFDCAGNGMISIVLYGRNDNYGYNLHKRAALSLNCMAQVLTAATDEIIFVDYNTPNDFPTFPEAIQDTLTARAKRLLRTLRVRPAVHARYAGRTHLQALEPIARNVAVRRSNPANRWILSTNTDMIFVPRSRTSLTAVASKASDGFYHLPQFEIPESLWETLDRRDPAGVIRTVRRWGLAFHLNEIVYMGDPVKFDGPGDFQMMLRNDLLRIHGFDERMLLGWHVDSNIARRLTFLRGSVGDFTADLLGYHCDHTRQVTPAHRPGAVMNDTGIFITDVKMAEIEEQAADWGLANESIEEVRLSTRRGFLGRFFARDDLYVGALRAAIDGEMLGSSSFAYVRETFDHIGYNPNHVVPFLADALVCYPRNARLGWFGSRRDLLVRFAKAWEAMGFSSPILVGAGAEWLGALPSNALFASPPDMASDADVFVFDFGLPAQITPNAQMLPGTARALRYVATGLRGITRVERDRLEHQSAPLRRLIAVNAVHSRFETLTQSCIGAPLAPISTRLRQGFVVKRPEAAMSLLPLFAVGDAGKRKDGLVSSAPDVAGFIVFGPGLALEPGVYNFRLRFVIDEVVSAAVPQSAPLLIDIVSIPYLITFHTLTPADLASGEVEVPFSITQELIDLQEVVAVEFRLRTQGNILVTILDAVVKSVEQSLTQEPQQRDWLPVMTIGPAGERCGATDALQMPDIGSAGVRAKGSGFVIFGPNLTLLPGRYELSMHFYLDAASQKESEDGVDFVVIEVIAQAQFFLAYQLILRRDLRSGFKRLEFSTPGCDPTSGEAMRLEFRVRVVGEVQFTIGSVHTRRLSENPGVLDDSREIDWLPLMATGVAGESYAVPGGSPTALANDATAACSPAQTPPQLVPPSSMRVRSAGEGIVVYGPYCGLMAGRYQLAIDLLAEESGPPEQVNKDGLLVIDVFAQPSCCLAELSIPRSDLRSETYHLEFDIPSDFANGPDEMLWEFRIRTLGQLRLSITSVRTRKLSDEPGLSPSAVDALGSPGLTAAAY